MKHYHKLIWNDKNIAHIARHHVLPDEVEDAVFSSRSWHKKGRSGTYYIFGKSIEGRYLFIVLREFERGVGYVITARDMSDKERRLYTKHRG